MDVLYIFEWLLGLFLAGVIGFAVLYTWAYAQMDSFRSYWK